MKVRGFTSRLVLWGGLALIALIAVPAVILSGAILLVRKGTDAVMRKLERKTG